MIEQYIDWLLQMYSARHGHAPAESNVGARATASLRSHAARLSAGDEFVSLAAAEIADRLSRLDEPFLRTIEKASDAVRHKLIRDVKRWRTNREDFGQIPTPPPADDAAVERIKTELLEGLSVEEHSIVEKILAGESVENLANHLGVSRRTLYRRIEQIKQQLGS